MGDQEGQGAGLASVAGPVSPAKAATSSAESSPQTVQGPAMRFMRKVLHVWFRLSRGMTLGVRAIVVDGERRVFLVRHSYLPGWHLPGGGVEVGQTLRMALETELREEGNIRLTGDPELLSLYNNAPEAPRDHVAVYIVRSFVQEGPRLPDREIVECGFFSLDALPEATTAGTRRRLEELAGLKQPSPYW